MPSVNITVSSKGSGNVSSDFESILSMSYRESTTYSYLTISGKSVVYVTYDQQNNRYNVSESLYLKKTISGGSSATQNVLKKYPIIFSRWSKDGASGKWSWTSSNPNVYFDDKKVENISDTGTLVASWSCGYIDASSYKPSTTASGSGSPTLYWAVNDGSDYHAVNFKTSISAVVYGTAVQRTIRFSGGIGTIKGSTSKTGYDGESFSLSSYSATKSKEPGTSFKYTISYENLSVTSDTTTVKPYTNYSFSGWTSSNTGKFYSSTAYYTISGSDTLTAKFSTYTTYDPEDGKCKIKNLTTSKPIKLGYISDGIWHYSNSDGNVASVGDIINSNTKLYSGWSPKTYKISFHLDGGKMPEEYGRISDYTTEKTYGVNSAKTPLFTPTKVGYKFIGWRNQAKTSTLLGVNATINDDAYNKANTAQTNTNVVLYAQWEYNENRLQFNYFINDTKVTNEYLDYNIDSTEVKKYSPNRVNEMGGDYVFLGWCIELPENYGWDTAADPSKQGYHGIYTNPLDVPKGRNTPQYPVEVDVSKLKNLDDWGKTQVYYGVWSKTGKYIKIGNKWRKANSSYVKINGKWKIITDIWTRKNDTWVKEI